MELDFQHRIKAMRAEIEALKTASRSNPDGIQTTTKRFTFPAKMIVYTTYISGLYFIELTPQSSDTMIFSASQKHTVVSDDVIAETARPYVKDGNKYGLLVEIMINYQVLQSYLAQYSPGDVITKDITLEIVASDDFTYTITEEN